MSEVIFILLCHDTHGITIDDNSIPEIHLQVVEVTDTTISKGDNLLISVIAMKKEIISSISNGNFLSSMQLTLMEQINLPLREFADWKNFTFPNARILPNHLSHIKLEISELLISTCHISS